MSREDLVGTGSRISWGPIFAGSVLALSLYFLLSLLGAATGFSVSEKFDARNIGIGAAVYAIVVTAFCLFIGGAVSTQLAVGENKREAGIYGLLVWSLTFAMMLALMVGGVRAGFGAMVGVVTAGSSVAQASGTQNATTPQTDLENAARKAGYTDAQIADFKAKLDANIKNPTAPNVTKEEALATGTNVTWIAFAGTLISMLAAVAGGMFGAGPTLQLLAVPVARGNLVRA
jgi:hypothetical protein